MPGMTDIAHLQRIIAAYGSDDPVAAVFQALDQALTNKPGHRLFTILVYHPQLAQSQRAEEEGRLEDAADIPNQEGQRTMTESPTTNKRETVARNYVAEVFTGGNAERARDYFTPDVAWHGGSHLAHGGIVIVPRPAVLSGTITFWSRFPIARAMARIQDRWLEEDTANLDALERTRWERARPM